MLTPNSGKLRQREVKYFFLESHNWWGEGWDLNSGWLAPGSWPCLLIPHSPKARNQRRGKEMMGTQDRTAVPSPLQQEGPSLALRNKFQWASVWNIAPGSKFEPNLPPRESLLREMARLSWGGTENWAWEWRNERGALGTNDPWGAGRGRVRVHGRCGHWGTSGSLAAMQW